MGRSAAGVVAVEGGRVNGPVVPRLRVWQRMAAVTAAAGLRTADLWPDAGGGLVYQLVPRRRATPPAAAVLSGQPSVRATSSRLRRPPGRAAAADPRHYRPGRSQRLQPSDSGRWAEAGAAGLGLVRLGVRPCRRPSTPSPRQASTPRERLRHREGNLKVFKIQRVRLPLGDPMRPGWRGGNLLITPSPIKDHAYSANP